MFMCVSLQFGTNSQLVRQVHTSFYVMCVLIMICSIAFHDVQFD